MGANRIIGHRQNAKPAKRGSEMKRHIKNEKGFALILALVMMFLMSILGTIIFNVSSSEVLVSRNYRVRQDAMYAAERAMEYSRSDGNIYATIDTGSVNVPLTGVSLMADSSNASGTVQFVSNGNPPRGSGVDVTQFQANYYVINVTGTGPGNSSVQLEVNHARILPKQ